MNTPKHISLSLHHNEHNNYYMTVRQMVEAGDHGYDDWVSEEQKAKAIATNDCWYIQWYPETPIGFYTLAAADLDALLEATATGQ